MSLYMDWNIAINLEGEWSKKAVENLHIACGWWTEWCEYADFLSKIKELSAKRRSVDSIHGYSDKISLESILLFSVSGENTAYEEDLCAGFDKPEERESYNAEVQAELVAEMYQKNLSIEFEYSEIVEEEEMEGISTSIYSDGEKLCIPKM